VRQIAGVVVPHARLQVAEIFDPRYRRTFLFRQLLFDIEALAQKLRVQNAAEKERNRRYLQSIPEHD
jgi:hypothetical protein